MRFLHLRRLLQIEAGAKRFPGSAQNQIADVDRPRHFRSPRTSSVINSIVSALRRSGRLSVMTSNLRCLFFDENDWHDLDYAVSNTRHDGIRQAHRMSARRLAGAATPNSHRRKVEYLRGLMAAGFRHIDAVSFVSPKAVPQMADSEAVLEQLGTTG